MKAKLLENMSLDELTDVYLCNKYGKDPVKCLDCENSETCPAGKRAIELLNEMTGGDQKESKWKKMSDGRKIKARKIAEELSKMEDPIKYLIEVEGKTVHCARERMRKYRITYPELFTNNSANTKSYSAKRAKNEAERKTDYEMAAASDSPIQYYVDKYGLSRDAAWHRWKDAEKKFKKEEEVDMKAEEEVSLEDFLKESATDTEDTAELEEEVTDIPQGNGDLIRSINAKYEEFLLKREKIKEEIMALEEKLSWHDAALRSFEMTMSILEKEQ